MRSVDVELHPMLHDRLRGIEFLESEPVRPADSRPCLQARQGLRGQPLGGPAVSCRHEQPGCQTAVG